MLYHGEEEYVFVKDNDADIEEYNKLNKEQMQAQGWEFNENNNFYIIKRKIKLLRQLPVIDATYTERVLEGEGQ